MVTKDQYTKIVSEWLNNYLTIKYSKEYRIEVLIPDTNISRINNDSIKRVENYSLLDFCPDVLGILVSKRNNDVKLVLLNRSISAISVKEIGEMNIYSYLINPELAFIASLRGLPNEVNSLLLNEDTCHSLLDYNGKNIFILKIDENKKVDNNVTFPREFKNSF